MASTERIYFGQSIEEGGRYELCTIEHSEGGEVVSIARKVVVEKHGPYWYFRWADADFNAIDCGHEGLRCDLLDPDLMYFRCPDVDVLLPDQVIEPDDEFYYPGGGDRHPVRDLWIGMSVRGVRLHLVGPITVIRPRANEPELHDAG